MDKRQNRIGLFLPLVEGIILASEPCKYTSPSDRFQAKPPMFEGQA